MDTNKKYVKMCEKAEDIQKLWQPQCGDIMYDENWGLIKGSNPGLVMLSTFRILKGDGWKGEVHASFYSYQSNGFKNLKKFKEGKIWLPRQDHLQEMFIHSHPVNKWDDEWTTLTNMFNGFISWWDTGNVARGKFNSMEQLWMAFFMLKKYYKTWNGTSWEEIKWKKRKRKCGRE